MVEQTVCGLGYDLVDVERGTRGLLRVYIDCLPRGTDGGGGGGGGQEFITVEDCEKVTRQLQHVLEVEGCSYERLEVSSPGLDRPLKKSADFERFIGHDIEIQLKEPFHGRRKFKGILMSQVPLEGEDALPSQAGEGPTWQLMFQESAASHVLGFSLHELREARLVPVVDFKGRRFAAPPAEPNNKDKEDGDRDE